MVTAPQAQGIDQISPETMLSEPLITPAAHAIAPPTASANAHKRKRSDARVHGRLRVAGGNRSASGRSNHRPLVASPRLSVPTAQ